MKKLIPLCICVLSGFAAYNQQVVSWKFTANKIADKTYELHITATIDDGWHIYSQFTPKDGPSLPTRFSFNKNPLLVLSGKIKEVGTLITKHEEILDVNLKYFKNKVDFVQVVQIKSNIKTNITGFIVFMACTDERCLQPQTQNFSIVIGE